MAITQCYCDYATGNDYKGASFTDGAYTAATKTLVKANAFAASKVNHWLYLSSNDGGSIVAGYYRIATWTDASTVILATDAGGGVDDDAAKCTQAAGTTALPYRSVQGALDLITRNATDGDQINIKAGTADVLAASLTLATYGTPDAVAPLILRGYTSAADDGGVGVIDGGAAYRVGSSATDYLHLIDLRITNVGAAIAVSLRNYCSIQSCEIDTGGSIGVYLFGASLCSRCYVHDFTSNHGIYLLGGQARNNYVKNCGAGTGAAIVCENPNTQAHNNIVSPAANVNGIRMVNNGCMAIGNTVYASGSTAKGIIAEVSLTNIIVTNNIVMGFSGAGGKGISVPSTCVMAQYHSNAAYNNTTNFDVTAKFLGATGNNDALAADPFVNAAAGDFDINGTVAGVTEDGWPTSFLGATSTTPKIDKGASQAGAGSGGGGAVSISPFRGNIG